MQFTPLPLIVSISSSAVLMLAVGLLSKFYLRHRTGKLFKILIILSFVRMFLPFQFLLFPTRQIHLLEWMANVTNRYNVWASTFSIPRIMNIIPFWSILIGCLVIVWALVAAWFVFRDFQKYGQHIWKFRNFKHTKDERINRIDDLVRQDMQIKKRARIIYEHEIPKVCCSGFIRPSIYIPKHEWTDVDLYNLLLHEYTHIVHKDNWIKFAISLSKNLFWFNFLQHPIYRQFDMSCEHHCDESILHQFSTLEQRIAYCQTIVKAKERGRITHPSHFTNLSMALVEDLSDRTKRDFTFKRISTMLEDSGHKKTVWNKMAAFVFFVVSIASLCFIPFTPDYSDDGVFRQKSSAIVEGVSGTACLVERVDGLYDLYVDGEFLSVFEISKTDLSNNCVVFQTKEEMQYYLEAQKD